MRRQKEAKVPSEKGDGAFAPASATRGRAISRRSLLVASSLGVAGIGAGSWAATRTASQAENLTPVQRWRRAGPPYYVAHRGAGIVVPEHTMEGYRAALDWGATCIEVSVGMTSDEVLICMHDLTYDRTTNLSGAVANQPSSVLQKGRVTIPRLGPRWTGAGAPAIPLLSDVLENIGSRAVLCIECKNDDAFDSMLALVRRNGLSDSVMAKLHLPATARVEQARAAGLPIFMYAGSAADLEPAKLDPVLARLDPTRDVIVLPATVDDEAIKPEVVSRIVGRGIPAWVYSVWRRSDVTRFRELGVEGFITPNIGYLTGSIPVQSRDSWSTRGITSGELTRFPYSNRHSMKWTDGNALTLDVPDAPAFVLLGQISPVAAPDESYRLEMDVRFDSLPTDVWSHCSLAFAHADDAYYEHRAAQDPGYHVILRANGDMAIFAHTGGSSEGEPLGTPVKTPRLVAGQWTRVRLDVSRDTIRWSRDDLPATTVRDSRWRGGYVHVGRSGADGPLSLRRLQVTKTSG